MNRKINRKLKSERTRRVKEAVRGLLDTDALESAKQNLAWIEAYHQLMRSVQRATQAKWMFTIGFSCILAIGLASTLRYPFPSNVTLEIEAGNVSMESNEAWFYDGFLMLDRIVLDGISAIRAVGLNLEEQIDPTKVAADVNLQGKEIALETLELPDGTGVELSAKDDELIMYIKDKPVSGQLSVIERGSRRRGVAEPQGCDD